MRVAMGADHGGLDIKNWLAEMLRPTHEVIDLGAVEFRGDDDYPDFARAVAELVAAGGAERGIIVCGSGVGACIAANKVPGARACLCHDTYSAHQGVEHDNMNILCLGGRVIGVQMAYELAAAFVNARFLNEPRLTRRLAKVLAIERQALCKER